MNNKGWFNLVFMIVVTVFFTGILSSLYVYTRPRIETNAQLNEMRAYLYAFDAAVTVDATGFDIESIYNQRVTSEIMNDFEYLVYSDENEETYAYGFPFEGSGLWGAIDGIIVLTPDLEKVVGIDFTDQNETPGLGGRIDEDWYKEQFRDIELYDEGEAIRYGKDRGDGQVDAITGATSTSNAVVNILNEEIEKIRQQMGVNK